MRRKIIKKMTWLTIAWVMIFALLAASPCRLNAFAAGGVDVSGATSAVQGEVDVRIEYRVYGFEYDGIELAFDDDEGISVGVPEWSQDKESGSIKLSISRNANTGTRYFKLKFLREGTLVFESEEKSFQISERIATPGKDSGKSITAMDISHSISPAGGFTVGKENTITFEVFNKGNMMIRDAQLMLTLPEGLSVYNDSNTLSLGYLSPGNRRSIAYTIYVGDKVESKMQPITVQLTGFNYSSGEGATKEKTFYIPVEGRKGSNLSKVQDLEIRNIKIPSEVSGSNPFDLYFEVMNKGKYGVEDVKISLELPEKILNRTVSNFSEGRIDAGSVRKYTVSLFASPDAEKRNYPINIMIKAQGEEGGQISQYAGVFINPEEEVGMGVKTPQLMISGYGFGGSNVQAGGSFPLSLSLLNTSAKELRNIKVTLKDGDGQLVPLNSSNSFYIDSIDAKSVYNTSMLFKVKPQAEQKTASINVTMTYEDKKGNEFSVEDMISIPVTQEIRLVIDDIVPPYELYVGNPGSAEVHFYNMGKNTLSNVRVTAEGNFDVMETNSYYAGNIESGRSDVFTFTFIPRDVGPMDGVVTFTYEDNEGATQFMEVPFVFEAVEMPDWNEEFDPEEEEGIKVPWSLIIAGIVIVIATAAIIIWRRVRKSRKDKALEIQDGEWEKAMEQKGDR
ncbi:MAG: hypothetical protein ACOX4U_06880 [Anaerovoracaceae bacterium]